MIDRLRTIWVAIRAKPRWNALLDAMMRLPRPASFLLLLVMFTIGWKHPEHLDAFAAALARLPDQLWTVIYILLGSLTVTKVVNAKLGQ
jgi:hypothetical protein